MPAGEMAGVWLERESRVLHSNVRDHPDCRCATPVHGEKSGLNVAARITLQNSDGERGSCAGRALDSDVAAKELRQVPRNR